MRKIIGSTLTVIGILTAAINLIPKVKKEISISIIKGTDGPTSVFAAGKIGGSSTVIGIIVGIALFVTGIFIITKKK